MGSLIRVPYYCPEKYNETEKLKPDDRELESVDPILKVNESRIVKLHVGAPVILRELLLPVQIPKVVYKDEKTARQ